MSDTGGDVARAALARVHREEWSRVVASLTRRFDDLGTAEDAAAEAFAVAVERWPTDGIPPNPGAWLTTTAVHRAIDRIRRESKRDAKHEEAWMLIDDDAPEPIGVVEDDRLRLLFICCHPAIALESRVALTLRMIGGLTVAEIARALLVPETTIGQRITRAKAKIATAQIPYRVPAAADLPVRMAGVLTVLYLIFTEGYLASDVAGDRDRAPIRDDLTAEAIRMTRLLRALVPDDGEVTGLLALLLLTDARRAERVAGGRLIPLDAQDRTRWDADLIAEGHALVRGRLAVVADGGSAPGRYQLLAAINAVHTSAPSTADTAWEQIVALYDRLVLLDPSPVVALNRAVAVGELDGPEVALALVDRLEEQHGGRLRDYDAFHATRAELLRRLGRRAEALAAYDEAIRCAGNAAERAELAARRAEST